MRRKLSPAPIVTHASRDASSPRRALVAASLRTFALPTAAALLAVAAVSAVSAVGCGTSRADDVKSDPPARHVIATSASNTQVSRPIAAPSASAGGIPIIDPDPHATEGGPRPIVPSPTATISTTSSKPVPPSPPLSIPAATTPTIAPVPHVMKGGLGVVHPKPPMPTGTALG